jgi:outer membrane receptor protein involved in Fe transport
MRVMRTVGRCFGFLGGLAAGVALMGASEEAATAAVPENSGSTAASASTADHPGARALSAVEALREALGPERDEPFDPGTPVYGADQPGQMEPFVVFEFREIEPPQPEMRVSPMGFGLQLNLKMGWPEMRGPSVQTVARVPQRPEHVATTIHVLTASSLAFSTDSELIRRFSPAGISVADARGQQSPLVLIDGVPLNDPFDGIVRWSQAARLAVARVEHAPFGGASAWGDRALNGVVQLFSRPVDLSTVRGEGGADRAGSEAASGGLARLGQSGEIEAAWGDLGWRSIDVSTTHVAERGVLQLSGCASRSDGWYPVEPDTRGSVDRPAWARHRALAARWRQSMGPSMEALLTVRGGEDSRGHGTAEQTEHRREWFASARLAGRVGPTFAWNGLIYTQDQTVRRTRTRVDSARALEALTREQTVPVATFGALWTGGWWRDADARTVVGADMRAVEGEVRELLARDGSQLTRERYAGGTQRSGGVFASHDLVLSPQLRATLAARIDHWVQVDGHRTERPRFAFDGEERDEQFPRQHGTEFAPSASLVWRPKANWRWRVAGQDGYRRPTLSERYASAIRDDGERIEANPYLRPERASKWELGVDYVLLRRLAGAPQASAIDPMRAGDVGASIATLGVVAYRTEWYDRIALPLSAGGQTGDFVRQWGNVDRARTDGIRVFTTWRRQDQLLIDAEVRWEDSTVERWPNRSEMEGRRFPQQPRARGALGITWHAPAAITLAVKVHALGRRFDDEENARPLGRAALLDLRISRGIGQRARVYVEAENLGDARVEAERDARGVVRLGKPCVVTAGVEYAW